MFFVVQLLDEVVEAVGGDGADDHRLRAVGDAVLDLRDLLVEFGVAAGFDQVHRDAEALGLLDHAVVDAEPVGVLHMRERHADLPGLRRLVERRYSTGETCRRQRRRLDLLGLVREPVGG